MDSDDEDSDDEDSNEEDSDLELTCFQVEDIIDRSLCVDVDLDSVAESVAAGVSA